MLNGFFLFLSKYSVNKLVSTLSILVVRVKDCVLHSSETIKSVVLKV